MAVVEITNEPALESWKRLGVFKPSIHKKTHTMNAIVGTERQNFGTANITLYAYVRMDDLFAFTQKIEMYITPDGGIVAQHALPWSAVEVIRRNSDGYIIDKDTIGLGTPPLAPATHKRVQSRDSMGERYPPNIPRLLTPERTIITKAGVVHRSGFNNMLERMCTGNPQEQHIQLQMLKGLYKITMCRYDASGKCTAAAKCCFMHTSDNEYDISQRVMPLRKKVFTRLWNENFALPLEHLHEIGKISDQEYKHR